MLNRREALVGAMTLATSATAFAQTYPQRPVRIVVPYSPGGATDVYARIIAKNMSEMFKQPFVVDNKPGAATIVGAQAAATAPPDGYTLIFTVAATVTTNQFLYKKLPYKPEDFTPISLVGSSRYTLTINSNLPCKTIQEFVKYVKDRPGKTVMATLGSGSGGFLAARTFEKVYGLNMIEVPYKGSADALQALMAGTADLYPDGISGVLALHKAGKVRIVAVTSTERSPELPDVPTMVELGYPDFIVGNWFALLAPTGTPPDIINQLNAATVKIVAGDEFRGHLLANGIDPESSSPAQLAALIKRTSDVTQKILDQLNIPPQ
ncbi:tripartite tricarboxylate transporter substrate binding protein [soil metagenome]